MLEVNNISKKYQDFSLDNISFQVEKGGYFVLLGPSGAGKTQVLEIISGLVRPDTGMVLANGKDITHLDSRQRPVGIVFQDLAIFPHMSIEKNIAYGLKGTPGLAMQTKRLVGAQAEKLGISHLLQRKPDNLSGGELQRVALARTLVRQPAYLLLDEPLASLDVQLRHDLYGLLKSLHHAGQTILHVTHDFEETLVLATQVGVIYQGRIIQIGPASEVFHNPCSEFVARFTGIKNYFPAILQSQPDRQTARLNNGMQLRIITDEADGEGYVLIPGEEIILSRERIESSATNQLKGKVMEIFNLPQGIEVMIDAGVSFYAKITRESMDHLQLSPGSETWLSFKASGVRFIRA